jgi:alanine racemase
MRHSTYLEVNLSLLEENARLIQSKAPDSSLLPMVKADAYGNGIIPVSQFLVHECGVEILGCASLGEAIKLVEGLPDLKAKILVFSDTELQDKNLAKAYVDGNIIPVLHQNSDLEIVLKDPSYSKVPIVIKVNTGMNRLGVLKQDLETYLPLLRKRGIQHLMTHFARSSQLLQHEDKTNRQYEDFLSMKDFLMLNGVSIETTSVSNSGAVEQEFGLSETYLRPGLMLYGPSSVGGENFWRGHQISRWVTKVLSTFKVKKGTPIGYGVNVADKDSLIAVLPLGYGDGFLTYMSGVQLNINGVIGKVFGRVNMDMTFIQFDLKEEQKIKNNDIVEIWNNNSQTIVDLANQSKTIPYQLMCAVSGRIPRIYKVN